MFLFGCLFFICFPLCSPYLLLLIVSPVNKTKVFSQPPVSLSCFTRCRSVSLCRCVAAISVLWMSLWCVSKVVCKRYQHACHLPLSKRSTLHSRHLVCLCFDFPLVQKLNLGLCCVSKDLKPVSPPPCVICLTLCYFTSLCITGCFVSPFPGSENHRNKLQGMMADFPSKAAKPPSASGPARSGEGKTSPVALPSPPSFPARIVIHTWFPNLQAVTS